MDHDSYLRLLGMTTARGHQLELVTAQVLARTLRTHESTARLLVSAMGVGASLGVLQTLVVEGECGSLSSAGVDEWLRQAKTANQARNRVIHSPWVVRDTEAGVPDSVLARGSMKLEDRSDEDLQRDIELLALAVTSGSELLRQG